MEPSILTVSYSAVLSPALTSSWDGKGPFQVTGVTLGADFRAAL
jgi:hypothetical protein